MTVYLADWFDVTMLPRDEVLQILVYPLAGPAHAVVTLYDDDPDEKWVSGVFLSEVAEELSQELGIHVEKGRAVRKLIPGDRMVVRRDSPGDALAWLEIVVLADPDAGPHQ